MVLYSCHRAQQVSGFLGRNCVHLGLQKRCHIVLRTLRSFSFHSLPTICLLVRLDVLREVVATAESLRASGAFVWSLLCMRPDVTFEVLEALEQSSAGQ